jgi:hypothetical protein
MTTSTGSSSEPDDEQAGGAVEPSQHLPAEVLEKLPPEERRLVESAFQAAIYSGPFPNPIAQKLTPEHITQIIDATARDSQAEYDDRKHARPFLYGLLAFVSLLAAIVIIVLALEDKTDTLNEVIKLIAVFAGGAGSGFGFAEYRRTRRS